MAVYRDFDYPIRINGDVNIPSSYNLSVGGTITLNGVFKSADKFSFLNGEVAQIIKTGGVLASDIYADDVNIPTNGIYSKGNIDTPARVGATSFKVASTFTDLVNNAPWYGLGLSNVVSGSGFYTQLAGYYGVNIKSQTNELKIPKAAGDMTYNGSIVYHAGNFNTSNFVTNGTDQSTGTNFSVKGTMFLGSTGGYLTTGDLIMYNGSGNRVIHLDGDSSGKTDITNVKAYIAGNGNASFAGTVDVNKIMVFDRGLIANLNAELLNGKSEEEFVKNATTKETGGYGVYTGFEYSIFDGNTLTLAPAVGQAKSVVYTQSGRRKEFNSINQSIPSNGGVSGDIYHVIYIKGPSQGQTEGDITFISGTLGGGEPNIDADAVKLYVVKRRPSNASISAADVTDVRRWKSLIYDGSNTVINTPLLTSGAITEEGKLLTAKYTQLGTSGSPINNILYGRQVIQSNGTLSRTTTSNNYYLKITDGVNHLMLDPNEIVVSNDLVITTGIGSIQINTSVEISKTGYLKASKNATKLTINAGSTSVRWTHNFGNIDYAVSTIAGSAARHVYYDPATLNANYIDICIDDPHDVAIDIMCILIGY